ncbi:MAG TPA: DEAD/DEAH box helicase [Alphaproteobacteria bacterium]|jgi:ATP-dependent RNA helicase RhlE
MSIQTFAELDLIEPLQHALRTAEYTKPTPIQAQSIPYLLAGRDLLGCAQTGTGKTAAFALPILQRLASQPKPFKAKSVRALILTPTRELALQIAESFATYGRYLKITHTVVMGGVGHVPQIKTLARGVDVLIATPGRLMEMVADRHVDLGQVEVFVLDEADRMLDMGFIRDVRKVIAHLPADRQSLLFSATMPGDISKLATSLLKDPVKVEVTPVATTAERIAQKLFYVEKPAKNRLLAKLMEDETVGRAIVFSRTKHGANKIAEVLERSYKGGVEVIHGNKSQSARVKALENFRAGQSRVLIATDIAARGIDVDGVTHVINFDLPNEPESYVHRIGRTARAGAEGIAWSFCDGSERAYLKDIEKLTRQRIFVEVLPELPPLARGEAVEERAPRRPQNGSGRNGQNRNGGGQGRSNGSGRGGAPGQGPKGNNGGNRQGQARSSGSQGEGRQAQGQRGNEQHTPRNAADFRSGDYRDEGRSSGNGGVYRADGRPTPAGASEGERPRRAPNRRPGGAPRPRA